MRCNISFVMPLALLLALGGCASTNSRVLDSDAKAQLEQRSYQSRVFDIQDTRPVLRNVIATLQDLDFVIDKSDATMGIVSASKFDEMVTKITVTVRSRGERQVLVRANAQYGNRPIENPVHYQDFFASLEKSLFLAANAVE